MSLLLEFELLGGLVLLTVNTHYQAQAVPGNIEWHVVFIKEICLDWIKCIWIQFIRGNFSLTANMEREGFNSWVSLYESRFETCFYTRSSSFPFFDGCLYLLKSYIFKADFPLIMETFLPTLSACYNPGLDIKLLIPPLKWILPVGT